MMHISSLLFVSVFVPCITGDLEQINEVRSEPGCAEGEEGCGNPCQLLQMRHCMIQMEYTIKPVKILECRENDCSSDADSRQCFTKYHTECGTELVYRDIEEDHPVCGIQEQEQCSGSECRRVPVRVCTIEKKIVRRAQPETSCKRIPVEMCQKKECEKMKCGEKVMLDKVMVPREVCQYENKLMCNGTDTAADFYNTTSLGDTPADFNNTTSLGDTAADYYNTTSLGDTPADFNNTTSLGDTPADFNNTTPLGDTPADFNNTTFLGDSKSSTTEGVNTNQIDGFDISTFFNLEKESTEEATEEALNKSEIVNVESENMLTEKDDFAAEIKMESKEKRKLNQYQIRGKILDIPK